MNAVAFIAGGSDLKFEILFLRIEKRQLLRITEKNIDVVAFAMIQSAASLLYHRRTSSDR